MPKSMEEQLAESKRHYLVAPAGCGKTELIARAAALAPGRQLILTHTHAGVNAIRARLAKHGVPADKYRIETIAGWSLRFVAAYPRLTGIDNADQLALGNAWNDLYAGAATLLGTATGKAIIRNSYAGCFVDEYQDCNVRQHRLVLALADLLPCRILGDPLQGIFDFDGDIVDWGRDVDAHFEGMRLRLPPWRWAATNPRLGRWLLKIRSNLEHGQPVSLDEGWVPVKWKELTFPNQVKACNTVSKYSDAEHSIVAIHRLKQHAHKLASSLGGRLPSMEEIYSEDLLQWAGAIEDAQGAGRIAALIDFAALCMTNVKSELSRVRGKVESGDFAIGKMRNYANLLALFGALSTNVDMCASQAILELIQKSVRNARLYRRELWQDMKKVLAKCQAESGPLREIAWQVRHAASIWGRRAGNRVVSRTLLVKGLEFDHAIVLDADSLSAKELYVALTRGTRTVTLLSKTPIITPV